MHIYRLNRNKSPLKNLGQYRRGRTQELPKIFRAAIYRTHRAVIFAIGQLSCFLYWSLPSMGKCQAWASAKQKICPFQGRSINPNLNLKVKWYTCSSPERTSQSNGISPAIWDHTVLPVTRHKWTHPALTQPYMQVLDLPTPDVRKAELT